MAMLHNGLYPTFTFSGSTVYITNADDCDKHCKDIVASRVPVLGFDVEWRVALDDYDANRPRDHIGKVALVQLCSPLGICYLFHITQFAMTKSLTDILLDERMLKVGLNIVGDMKKLFVDYACVTKGCVELGDVAKRVFVKTHRGIKWNLARLTLELTGHQLAKSTAIQISDWELIPLPAEHLAYAAADAASSLECFARLVARLQYSPSKKNCPSHSDESANPSPSDSSEHPNKPPRAENHSNRKEEPQLARHEPADDQKEDVSGRQSDVKQSCSNDGPHPPPTDLAISPQSNTPPTSITTPCPPAKRKAGDVETTDDRQVQTYTSPFEPLTHFQPESLATLRINTLQYVGTPVLSHVRLVVYTMWHKHGLFVGDIAKERGVSERTVIGYLVDAIEKGLPYTWDRVPVSDAKLAEIRHAVKTLRDKHDGMNPPLKQIKDLVSGNVSYEDIKLSVAHLKRESGVVQPCPDAQVSSFVR